MITPTRIDPVDAGDLFELALALREQRDEAEQNAALLEITRTILKWERDRVTKEESRCTSTQK